MEYITSCFTGYLRLRLLQHLSTHLMAVSCSSVTTCLGCSDLAPTTLDRHCQRSALLPLKALALRDPTFKVKLICQRIFILFRINLIYLGWKERVDWHVDG